MSPDHKGFWAGLHILSRQEGAGHHHHPNSTAQNNCFIYQIYSNLGPVSLPNTIQCLTTSRHIRGWHEPKEQRVQGMRSLSRQEGAGSVTAISAQHHNPTKAYQKNFELGSGTQYNQMKADQCPTSHSQQNYTQMILSLGQDPSPTHPMKVDW